MLSTSPHRSWRRVIGLCLRLLAGLVLGSPAAAFAQAGGGKGLPGFGQPAGPVTVSVEVSDQTAAPGAWVVLAITLDHQQDWHTHTHAPVLPASWEDLFVAIPTTVAVAGPEGLGVGPVQWPESHELMLDLTASGTPEPYAVYEGRAVAFVPVRLPEWASGSIELTVKVGYQACDDTTCDRPQKETHTVTVAAEPAGSASPTLTGAFSGFDAAVLTEAPLPTTDGGPAGGTDPGSAATGEGETITGGWVRLVTVAFFGAIGGFVLNLTPCVLPVIPIKVMTLVKHGGEHRSRTLLLGAWMAVGVVAFWVAIGLPMAFLNSALDPSRVIFGNWWVTLGLGLLIAFLGVGIMGLFVINLPQSVYAVNPKADTAHGSFLFGVMTAVLGLPCFGFVAGGLLAGAATMPASQIMAVFGGLGVGMAAPYLVLAAFPQLVKRIPRTGPASELVKQVMGLLMLAAAAFFIAVGIYTLIAEKPWLATNMKWWGAVLFIAAAGLWLTLRTFQITKRPVRRAVFTLIALAGTLGTGWFAADSTSRAKADHELLASTTDSSDYVLGAWNHYTPAKYEKAIADGKVVVVDFTAEWCLNCKAYKRSVLDRDPVRSRLGQGDVVAFEGDVTSGEDPANRLMEDLGITGIPQLAVVGPGLAEPMLSNAATGSEVVRRINLAAGATTQAAADPARKNSR
ncbi:MAG: thioredoxin family protein [Phycisphaerales bacterium]|nr:thioredoxin family protein [Phycisphaerales bacterium]